MIGNLSVVCHLRLKDSLLRNGRATRTRTPYRRPNIRPLEHLFRRRNGRESQSSKRLTLLMITDEDREHNRILNIYNIYNYYFHYKTKAHTTMRKVSKSPKQKIAIQWPKIAVSFILGWTCSFCVSHLQTISGSFFNVSSRLIVFQPPPSSAAPLRVGDWREEVEEFLSTFTAANPEYTEQCKAYLQSPQHFNEPRQSFINWKWHFSQYNQDWFMLINFFLDYAKTGKRGYYVESGAHHPLRVSNTAFLDFCLGWDGLCIEPNPRNIQSLKQSTRTCKLVSNCLSNKNETINLQGEIPGGEIGTKGGTIVDCARLDSILQQEGVSTVDIWSLDIEGFEHKALSGIDLTKFDVKTILMEQQDKSGVCSQFPIDFKLTTSMGYRKYRLVSDAFYVKLNTVNERYTTLQFPDPQAFDAYFLELESNPCREKGSEFSFIN